MDRLYRRGYRAICSYNTKAITRKNWRNRVLAWRKGKAGCHRLRHASGKVEWRTFDWGNIQFSKSSLPRLGDSRRGENPVNPTPRDGCQSDRDYSNYGASLQMKIRP